MSFEAFFKASLKTGICIPHGSLCESHSIGCYSHYGEVERVRWKHEMRVLLVPQCAEHSYLGTEGRVQRIMRLAARHLGWEIWHVNDVEALLEDYYPDHRSLWWKAMLPDPSVSEIIKQAYSSHGRAGLLLKIAPFYESAYTKYFVLRDVLRAAPKRPRCPGCGWKFLRGRRPNSLHPVHASSGSSRMPAEWKTRGVQIGTYCTPWCEDEWFRQNELRLMKEKRDKQWLREGKKTLKQIRRYLNNNHEAL